MRKNTNTKIVTVIVSAFTLFSINLCPQNLLANGDFESGGAGTGFNVDTGYVEYPNPPFPIDSSPGWYFITNNPQYFLVSYFTLPGGDHTTGSGKLLYMDANNISESSFWKAGSFGSGVYSLSVGNIYLFKYWVRTFYGVIYPDPVMANIVPHFGNATDVSLVVGNTLVPQGISGWKEVAYTFKPTNSNVTIDLTDSNGAAYGHDFVLDDVSLTLLPPCPTTAPAVATPLYLCQGSTASPLTATPDAGNTLVWYTVATGGTPSVIAPTPSTAANGTTSYYVSQSNGVCEGPRATINVTVNSINGSYNIFCDQGQATTANSVFFDWGNLPTPAPHNYTINYSINGGPVTTITTGLSHWEVFGVQPGQNVTLTIVSNEGVPCVGPETHTCSLPCAAVTVPVFASIPASICSGSAAPALPTTSDNGITGTWSPSTISNTTNGSYLFTPNPATFPCASTLTKNITVESSGTLSGNQTVCTGSTTDFDSTVPGGTWISSNLSVATINNATGVINGISPGMATMTYSAPGTGGCQSIRNVNVIAAPNAGTLNGSQNVCAGGLPAVFTSTVPGGAWTSSSIAIATVNSITGSVSGISGGIATITYTVTAPNGCTGTATRTVNVSAVPSAGTLNGTQNICAGQTVPFTSTVSGGTWTSSNTAAATIIAATGAVTGVAAGISTITYTIAGTGGCGNGTATRQITVTDPPNAGTLSGTQSICEQTSATFSSTSPGGTWTSDNVSVATVNATGLVTGVAPGTANINYTAAGTGNCSNDVKTRSVTIIARQVPTFNPVAPICEGSPLAPLPTTSINGFTGTWSPALNNTASMTYTFTPNAASCATTTTLTINVRPKLTPVFSLIPTQCVNDPNVPILPTVSQNGVTGTWTPATVSLATAGTQTYTFHPNASECVAAGPFTLDVSVVPNIVPNFPPIAPFCYGKTNVPTLDSTSPNGVEGTWNPSVISNTVSGSYIFTPNTVVNQCAAQQTLIVTVIPKTQPDFPAVAFFCVNTTAPILTNVSPNGVNGTWSPAIVDNSVVGTSNYLFTPNAGECALTQTLSITVTPGILPDFTDIAVCKTAIPPILNTVSPNGINGTWTPPVIDMSLIGTNPYVFTPLPGECGVPQTINITVNEYRLSHIEGIVSNYFEDLQVITVIASNSGNYLYQLDSGPFQESNVFSDVSAGLHTITVADANNCGPSLSDPNIMVINYPKFFTPNGDNYNDRWNIAGLKYQNATISIFDRYGKMIKQISPHGDGWDGKYNDVELPSSDYWFTVDYQENGISKQFKSHFTLKR